MCTQPKQTTLDGWCDRTEDSRKLPYFFLFLFIMYVEKQYHSIITSVENTVEGELSYIKNRENNNSVNYISDTN